MYDIYYKICIKLLYYNSPCHIWMNYAQIIICSSLLKSHSKCISRPRIQILLSFWQKPSRINIIFSATHRIVCVLLHISNILPSSCCCLIFYYYNRIVHSFIDSYYSIIVWSHKRFTIRIWNKWHNLCGISSSSSIRNSKWCY